ncbi:MAG: hypothetical protein KAS40_14300 [Desulfobacterales bacterium]|nr:hypothetical protein [Desulfobacterales bacterium]
MKRWLVLFVKSLMAVVILLPIATAGIGWQMDPCWYRMTEPVRFIG